VAQVKGSTLGSRLQWVDAHHGPEGRAKLMATLQPDSRLVVERRILKSAWYPFEAFLDVTVCIDKLFGVGDLALCKELGRFGADANLPTLYRLFYILGSVRWIMDRAAALWGVNYDSGKLAIEHIEPGLTVMHIEGFATPHRAHCLALQGWAERSVELSGGTVLASDEVACRCDGAPRCSFRMRWR
jgi:hypothetical protein